MKKFIAVAGNIGAGNLETRFFEDGNQSAGTAGAIQDGRTGGNPGMFEGFKDTFLFTLVGACA